MKIRLRKLKIYKWEETGYIIKKISVDGLCKIRSFQEGLKICYLDDVLIEEVIVKLRSEVLLTTVSTSSFHLMKSTF